MTQDIHTAESTSRTRKVQGIDIHYHEAGNGPETLILLHGTGPGASSWGNFRQNLPHFAESYRVLAIDLPHFGKSEKPMDNLMNVAYYASIVVDLLNALEISKAHFLGNSVGGSVAIEVALSRPEMIDRLVLMGTAGSLPMFSARPPEGVKLMSEFHEEPTREKMERFVRSMIYDQGRITPEFIDERYAAAMAPELLVHRKLDLEWMGVLWRRVDQVRHKTLLIYGKEDRVVPWDTSLLLLRLMPNADMHVFSRSGHWTQWERAPEFNAVVQNFLTGPAA